MNYKSIYTYSSSLCIYASILCLFISVWLSITYLYLHLPTFNHEFWWVKQTNCRRKIEAKVQGPWEPLPLVRSEETLLSGSRKMIISSRQLAEVLQSQNPRTRSITTTCRNNTLHECWFQLHEWIEACPAPRIMVTVWLFFFFVGPHLWHMEVPRLGVKSELQLPTYTTVTTTLDPPPTAHSQGLNLRPHGD